MGAKDGPCGNVNNEENDEESNSFHGASIAMCGFGGK